MKEPYKLPVGFYLREVIYLYVAEYSNNKNCAIVAQCASGEPWGTLSFNEKAKLPPYTFNVKVYSENEPWWRACWGTGMFEAVPELTNDLNCPVWRLKKEFQPKQ